MASIIMKRGVTSEISNTPISDGQILFETDTKNIYIDEGSNRIEYSSPQIWQQATLTPNTTYGSFRGSYNAWYRYDSTFIEIRIRGTYVISTPLPKGQAICRVSGLPIAIPHTALTTVWDDTAIVWRRFNIETDGYIKLGSNSSIPGNSWLSNETTNFMIYR